VQNSDEFINLFFMISIYLYVFIRYKIVGKISALYLCNRLKKVVFLQRRFIIIRKANGYTGRFFIFNSGLEELL